MPDHQSQNRSSHSPGFPGPYTAGQSIRPRIVHAVINPAAGTEQPVLGILNRTFRENDIRWEAFVTQDQGDARRYARQSAAGEADIVMACGGDGTVMEVASGLRGSEVPLAILPIGTANVMAMELGIPANLQLAVDLIAKGRNVLRQVDMGKVNNYEFLLRLGVGTEAQVIKDTPREAKNRLGLLAYVLRGVNQLADPQVAQYRLNIDGLRVEVDGITLYIANSMNVGVPGLRLVQDVQVDDGLLDVVLVRRSDLPSLIAIATSTLLNRAEEPEPLLHWQAQKITVECSSPQAIQVDGEIIPYQPLVIQVIPKAILVACPAPDQPNGRPVDP